MHSALRLVNLAVVLIAVVAVTQRGGRSDAAYETGRWLGALLVSITPLLTFFGLRCRAPQGLRKTAVVSCTLMLVIACLGGLSAAMLQTNVLPALTGAGVISLLCALNIWGLRTLSRQEDAGEEEARGWLAGRYWRGELPLGVVFWAGGSVLLLIQVLHMAITGMFSDQVSMRASAALVLVMYASGVMLVTWQTVGVWRSASRRSNEGSRLWPFMAKLSVMAGVSAFAFLSVWMLWAPLREHAFIAAGKDRLAPIEARLTTDDSVLLLHGTFGTGSAEGVRRLLEASPSVRMVALSSTGGRLREAADVAAMVQRRGLDTYVDTRCESACTFVFLAGKERAATPNARIGFHRPSFAGTTPVAFDSATDGMLNTYRVAGIPGDFLDRVAATSPSDMWYPSQQELEKAGVINRVSLGGETSAIGYLAASSRRDLEKSFRSVPMMVAMEQHFPGTIEAAVQAAWMERTQGGIDSAVSSAARNVIGERYPRILASASDASLDQFASIMVEQMQAANAIGDEACKLLLAGELNIAQVLSPTLVRREHDWALAVLTTDRLVERAPVDPEQFAQAMADTMSKLPAEVVEVVAELDKFDDQPRRQCEATIELYDRIAKLPAEQRHLLLRGMFQSAAL